MVQGKKIMVCVSGASYSISVNGNVHGWFKGKRGLRQGDPLSPYLFTLVMEILTLLLQRKVRNSDEFQYHHLCEQQRIINLCFADDLFLFARGHPSSVSVIMDALEEFKQVSGLVPSIPKSTAYFCNVPNAIKASILNSMPFAEGVLPVQLESRVNDWRNKFLSLAGRLQLIRSVLSSMHIYWASVFILPSRIVHDLEQLMRGFLWCQGEMKKGKQRSWIPVCKPTHKGGIEWTKILFAATTTTFGWKGMVRLSRISLSTPGSIVDVIFLYGDIKLVTFKFKKMSTRSRLLLDQCKIQLCNGHMGSTSEGLLFLPCPSCLSEAMRVREEMKDIGLKARIANEVEANHKRIKKELEKKDVLRR
ncbi:putative reverse transcriptase domain, reverse transcriptase zinc-binding domain protein [Tanacetum coccineum]